ncbi:polymer-forming cytoskeletal protein [Methanoplanus limicola]|uniref:Acyltransferase n=1 Tax=Methanoplanus limicola DSM 2279 TaxID=937775 RepID=H1YWF4_9EURY|nr:polymer-forming cytoskeletal protein [Methanoplanus limicola]EHQ34876.1 hypothetical protein Metlim_0753 [Methanoplanus limicola DSM 2279]
MDDNRVEWFWQCTIPEGTELQEHFLKTEGVLIIGDRCKIDYGLFGDEIIVGEFTSINGNINSENDLRLDNWTEINGDIHCGADAYIGEGVKIKGRLVVEGDLDLGDNVSITEGFEAKGWISIRNPMPVITYLLLYLVAVLGLEKEEEISDFFRKLFSEDETEEKRIPLVIPPSSVLNMQLFSVPKSLTIGKGCRMHGNIRASSVHIHENNTIFGSLTADSEIVIERDSVVHGAVTSSSGEVTFMPGVHVLGNVRCSSVILDEDARLDGTIKAPEGVKIVRKR